MVRELGGRGEEGGTSTHSRNSGSWSPREAETEGRTRTAANKIIRPIQGRDGGSIRILKDRQLSVRSVVGGGHSRLKVFGASGLEVRLIGANRNILVKFQHVKRMLFHDRYLIGVTINSDLPTIIIISELEAPCEVMTPANAACHPADGTAAGDR